MSYLKALLGTAFAGAAVVAGLAVVPTSEPTPAPATTVAPVGGFCVFGTHGGKGAGCRGGSVNEGERWERSLKGTGRLYKDAGECAGKGVVLGTISSPPYTLPDIAGRSLQTATSCGMSKGY